MAKREQPSGEVKLNVVHHFMDNGKLVKKMPIEMEGQIIWVDCADEEQPVRGSGPPQIPSGPGSSINMPSPNNMGNNIQPNVSFQNHNLFISIFCKSWLLMVFFSPK